MPLRLKSIAAAVALSFGAISFGQAATAPAPPAAPSSILRPALSQVQAVTAGLNISKWKAPRSVRKAAQEDVDSIQRDLGGTLPTLLAQADATPGSVSPSFAVYRNLDALYDVLLRVSQTADLTASSGEASAVASSLQQLESARSALGEAILNTSQHHESEILELQSQLRLARTAAAPHRHETVIDDGPASSPKKVRRHRVVHKKPATNKSAKPSPSSSSSTPNSH